MLIVDLAPEMFFVSSLDAEARQAILDRIDALQAVLDEGKSPTEGMIKKLKNLL